MLGHRAQGSVRACRNPQPETIKVCDYSHVAALEHQAVRATTGGTPQAWEVEDCIRPDQRSFKDIFCAARMTWDLSCLESLVQSMRP